MSAQPCGCDREAGWICKMHQDRADAWQAEQAAIREEKFNREFNRAIGNMGQQENIQQDLADTTPVRDDNEATPEFQS